MTHQGRSEDKDVHIKERVLAVCDTDNLRRYFMNVGSRPIDIINHYQNGRFSEMQPIFFISVDAERPYDSRNPLDVFIRSLKLARESDEIILEERPRRKYLRAPRQPGGPREKVVKGYSDVAIVATIVRYLSLFDTLMLFAGDSDFGDLVNVLHEFGKRVELYHAGVAIRQDFAEMCDLSVNMSASFTPFYPEDILRDIERERLYPCARRG